MVEATRWSSCTVGWLWLWDSLGGESADIRYGAVSLGRLNPSPIHRNIRVTRVNDLIRVVTLHATVAASGPLTYLMGCGVASNDSYQVCYLWKRMVLTEATGDAELVLWDGREFSHCCASFLSAQPVLQGCGSMFVGGCNGITVV